MKTEVKKTNTTQTDPNKHRGINENVWGLLYVLIFARRPKVLKPKKWRIAVKNRAYHRRCMAHDWKPCHSVSHLPFFSHFPGDFPLEINQQIFSTHPALQSRSYSPYLAASSQRHGAGFISVITCRYVCRHPEGDCTSLGFVVEWLETWSCLMMIHVHLKYSAGKERWEHWRTCSTWTP